MVIRNGPQKLQQRIHKRQLRDVLLLVQHAKTDEFTYEEFLDVGKVIGAVWRKRLG